MMVVFAHHSVNAFCRSSETAYFPARMWKDHSHQLQWETNQVLEAESCGQVKQWGKPIFFFPMRLPIQEGSSHYDYQCQCCLGWFGCLVVFLTKIKLTENNSQKSFLGNMVYSSLQPTTALMWPIGIYGKQEAVFPSLPKFHILMCGGQLLLTSG